MDMNEQQYERIARYLDGEDITLQPDERTVVEDIHRADAVLGKVLDVTPPADALHRALRRRHVATLLSSRRTLRFTLAGAAAAAAAAIVLLAMNLLFKPATSTTMIPYKLAHETDVPRPGTDVPMSDMINSLKSVSTLDHDLNQLAEEFEREEFGITATPDIVGEVDDKPDVKEENLRQYQEKDLWNVPDKIESVDPVEAY